MNYLAHFLLAQPKAEWVAGALAGDFVKGPLRGAMCAGIEQGILLHRRIDACSDRLPLLREYRLGLPHAWRRFSGPALDLLFDQQLALKWPNYHCWPLREFSAMVNATLFAQLEHLDANSQRFAAHLASHDLLCAYQFDSTISRAARAMASRSRYQSQVLAAFEGMFQRPGEVAELFDAAFPEIIAATADIKLELDPGALSDASSRSSRD